MGPLGNVTKGDLNTTFFFFGFTFVTLMAATSVQPFFIALLTPLTASLYVLQCLGGFVSKSDDRQQTQPWELITRGRGFLHFYIIKL